MITSTDNEKVRYMRALAERKGRRSAKAFAVEGVRAVGDALTSGRMPRTVLYDPAALARTADGARLLDELTLLAPKTLFEAEAKVVQAAGDTVTSQGIIAAFDLFGWSEADCAARPLQVVLDNIQDPGNLGTILRTAAAAGNCALWLLGGTVDPFSPKAVRAGMGAQFRVPFQDDVANWADLGLAFGRMNLPAPPQDETIPAEVEEGAAVWLADSGDEPDAPPDDAPASGPTITTSRTGQRKWIKPTTPRRRSAWEQSDETPLEANDLYEIDWRGRQAVIIGNEANGPSADARRFVRSIADATDDRGAGVVTIPMPGGFESLNAATAASLIIYEALRQAM